MDSRCGWMAIASAALMCSLTHASGFPSFERHDIGRAGNKMGQTSLVDVDRDGDLDWVVGCRGRDVWWFEYRSPDDWVRHLVGHKAGTNVGGTAFDVDGDGRVDQVSGSTWYRNTRGAFTRYVNGTIKCHDNVAADVDGDRRLDLVAMSDQSGLFWYRIPRDPTKTWAACRIGEAVHGGVAPRGVGDLDGDSDADIVRSTGWFENADGRGRRWLWHANIDGGNGGQYKDTTKSWIADMDGDRDNDVVMTTADSEAGTGWARWFENADGRGRRWTRHDIASGKGDLHTLGVADFDNDGDLDVFSGEGPLGATGPGGKRRWFVWENVDGAGARWREHVVLEGPRCHEGAVGDVDGDGDVDICSKPWNGDLHVYLRNMHRERGGASPTRR